MRKLAFWYDTNAEFAQDVDSPGLKNAKELCLERNNQFYMNLITTLDFMQTEAVSDVVKEMRYRIYFISDGNEIISNENIYYADRKIRKPLKGCSD